MPTISMFYGIMIRMFPGPSEHPPPRFHAVYGEHEAQFEIATDRIIAGSLPSRQTKLVSARAELHRDELSANWDLLMNQEKPFRIDPLR